MRIFIASAYTQGDVAENVRRSMVAAHMLMALAHSPYCPLLSHFLHMHRPRPYEEWMALDRVWLAQCEAVLRLPGESAGADREERQARELGIPVYYSLSDIPAVTR